MCLIVAVLILAVLFAVYFLIALGTVLALLPWLIVGLVAGWVASSITESPHGILGIWSSDWPDRLSAASSSRRSPTPGCVECSVSRTCWWRSSDRFCCCW